MARPSGITLQVHALVGMCNQMQHKHVFQSTEHNTSWVVWCPCSPGYRRQTLKSFYRVKMNIWLSTFSSSSFAYKTWANDPQQKGNWHLGHRTHNHYYYSIETGRHFVFRFHLQFSGVVSGCCVASQHGQASYVQRLPSWEGPGAASNHPVPHRGTMNDLDPQCHGPIPMTDHGWDIDMLGLNNYPQTGLVYSAFLWL